MNLLQINVHKPVHCDVQKHFLKSNLMTHEAENARLLVWMNKECLRVRKSRELDGCSVGKSVSVSVRPALTGLCGLMNKKYLRKVD
jgi:hypothetical protein